MKAEGITNTVEPNPNLKDNGQEKDYSGYDDYSKAERYIDWEKFGPILSNITRIIPPEANTTEIKPHVTIHGGNPVNVDSDKRGRKDILPINPKKEM